MRQIESDREILKTKKDEVKNGYSTCADLKTEIESASSELKNMKATDEEADLIEGPYFELVKKIKSLKESYKLNAEAVKSLKTEIQELNSGLEKNKQ